MSHHVRWHVLDMINCMICLEEEEVKLALSSSREKKFLLSSLPFFLSFLPLSFPLIPPPCPSFSWPDKKRREKKKEKERRRKRWRRRWPWAPSSSTHYLHPSMPPSKASSYSSLLLTNVFVVQDIYKNRIFVLTKY